MSTLKKAGLLAVTMMMAGCGTLTGGALGGLACAKASGGNPAVTAACAVGGALLGNEVDREIAHHRQGHHEYEYSHPGYNGNGSYPVREPDPTCAEILSGRAGEVESYTAERNSQAGAIAGVAQAYRIEGAEQAGSRIQHSARSFNASEKQVALAKAEACAAQIGIRRREQYQPVQPPPVIEEHHHYYDGDYPYSPYRPSYGHGVEFRIDLLHHQYDHSGSGCWHSGGQKHCQ